MEAEREAQVHPGGSPEISRRKMLLEYESEFMRSRYGAQSTSASQQFS
jgi:hypothetical protein